MDFAQFLKARGPLCRRLAGLLVPRLRHVFHPPGRIMGPAHLSLRVIQHLLGGLFIVADDALGLGCCLLFRFLDRSLSLLPFRLSPSGLVRILGLRTREHLDPQDLFAFLSSRSSSLSDSVRLRLDRGNLRPGNSAFLLALTLGILCVAPGIVCFAFEESDLFL